MLRLESKQIYRMSLEKNITDYAAWQHFSVVLFCYLHIVKTDET